MTSAPVMSSVNSLNANFMNTTSTSKASDMDFKSFLDQPKADTPIANAVSNKQTVKNEEPVEVNEGSSAKKVTEASKIKETGREVKAQETDEVKASIEKVEEAISEELDVSVEDIEKALEALSLTMAALLDPQKLPEIVAYLSDSEDVLALTVDENLYESLTELTKVVDESVKAITDDLQIPMEDFEEALKALETIPEEAAVASAEAGKPVSEIIETEELPEETDKTFEEKITVTSSRKDTVRSQESENNNSLKTDITKETVSNDSSKALFERHEDNHQSNTFNFAENLIQKTLEVINEATETESFTTVEVERVLNQITEGIELNISPETSEINLRLHPESLGTVSVKVSSNNEGVLTAQFTAQNESVKAIIESQAVVLKETLESKGVTVEAVEVLVESHEFERNLSDQSKKNQDSNAPKKRGLRRIDLSEPIDSVENEDESLVREMMAMNGNSVDYIA